MSRRKAFLPATFVLGATVVLDKNPDTGRIEPVIAAKTMHNVGHGDVPYVRQGAPMWRKPKPAQFVQHFRNAASKAEAYAAAAKAKGVPVEQITHDQAMRAATPKQLRIVPLYRGVSTRFANVTMHAMRRKKRIEEERNAGKSVLQRALESVGLGNDDQAVAAA